LAILKPGAEPGVKPGRPRIIPGRGPEDLATGGLRSPRRCPA